MNNLRLLITSSLPLSDVLIDRLRRSTNSLNLQGVRSQGDGDRATSEQTELPLDEEDTFGWRPPAGTILPDQVLAATLLGRALDCNRQAVATIADGGVVVIEAPSSELVAPLVTIVRQCVIDPRWQVKDGAGLEPADARTIATTTVILFKRDGTHSSHNAESGNAAVGIGLQMRCPIIGIAANAEHILPRDLIRVADHRVVLSSIDAAAIASVVTAITGKSPTTVDPGIAGRATLSDLILAVRSDRSPDECVRRLQRLTAPSGSQDGSGPTLFELQGLGEAKTFALELLEDLQDFKAGRIPASALPKGVILSSPPGCGKTALARAIAKSAGVHFIATSYAAWQSNKDGHLGAVTRAIRSVFAEARANAPSILFIDEIDSLPTRGTDKYYDNWWTSLVNCLLEELDGFDRREALIVIGACNDTRRLDPALVRSGRLDKHIRIALPDPIALAGILRTHLGHDLEGVDLRPAAASANGATGADAERWVRGARRRARKAGRAITLDDLVAEIREGREDFPASVRRRVSYHEAGHAICAIVLGIGEPQSLAVNVAGGTILVERGAVNAQTAADIKRLITYTLAGRAAEELVFGDACAGCGGGEHSDLALASEPRRRHGSDLRPRRPRSALVRRRSQGRPAPRPGNPRRRPPHARTGTGRGPVNCCRPIGPVSTGWPRRCCVKGFLDRDEIRAAVHPLVVANITDKSSVDGPSADAPSI